MPPSRLFRSIVVFGSALGVGAVAAPGCDLYFDSGKHPPDARDGWHGIIDVGRIYDTPWDASWGIIDAPLPPDGPWGTIADAPNDAGSAPTADPTAPAEATPTAPAPEAST